MLLCCLAITQGAWADNHLAFLETFNSTNGTGGRDNQFTGSIATSSIIYDIEGCTSTKCGGAKNCLKIGTSSDNGIFTTPEIVLVGANKTATLTFNAAGWGSGTNTLTVSANEGVSLSGDINITLTNSSWKKYTINITLTTATSVQLTFTGKRGFIDDVRVEENVTAISAPTLPDEHLFWANTTEVATTNITLVPSDSTTVYYTTDGTNPSKANGSIATLTSNFKITGTTTVKAIAYYETVASNIVSRTYTVGETVNNIATFKGKNENDEVRLFIADNANTRVLHAADGKMYLRDNTGTLCMDFGTTATFNPAPQHNQHVAGWIVGKKQTVNGLPKLVATSNTNTNHLALAAPVTEAATAPKAIGNSDINSNVGDWVTVANVRNDGTPITVSGIYTGALVDVSGIITANNSITPVDYADIKPIVYVIDEDEAFVSPGTDITGATVRLKRTLKEGIWNTFCVPMDLAISGDMAGKYRQCNSISGNVMTFGEASSIEAGKPYLVKPDAEIANKVFSNVTLSATPAATVQQGVSGLAFIGTYSPKELKTDKTEQFLTASGKLAYPSSSANATLKGMRAYFLVPEGTEARVSIDGEETTALTLVNSEKRIVNSEVYDLQGRKVANPTKGMYIVDGKKVIIK